MPKEGILTQKVQLHKDPLLFLQIVLNGYLQKSIRIGLGRYDLS